LEKRIGARYPSMYVYYWRTWNKIVCGEEEEEEEEEGLFKADGGGGNGGHVMKDDTRRGLCGRV
jgi:hypothetical protein